LKEFIVDPQLAIYTRAAEALEVFVAAPSATYKHSTATPLNPL
jgi:hypothetical protein